jgi:hypothetical protein
MAGGLTGWWRFFIPGQPPDVSEEKELVISLA